MGPAPGAQIGQLYQAGSHITFRMQGNMQGNTSFDTFSFYYGLLIDYYMIFANQTFFPAIIIGT